MGLTHPSPARGGDESRRHRTRAVLASQLWACRSDFSQAPALLATLRRLAISFDAEDQRITVWGTLQKPRDLRERNRRLLRVTGCLIQHLAPGIVADQPLKNVCWRSGSIVISSKRIVRVTKQQDDTFLSRWSAADGAARIFSGARQRASNRPRQRSWATCRLHPLDCERRSEGV